MKADITVNKKFIVGKTDRRLYGSFVEHIGRVVYEGIYEPTHSLSDSDGFRTDVLKLVKEMGVSAVRYPGGNFVSSYHWEDGIGDKTKRPQKLNPAWNSVETNQVGIDDFQKWAKKADTDVIMAVNLGTRGTEDARNLVEYCNLDSDTYYAKLRKSNGFEKPFDIKLWCLGNEMGGLGQIGRKTADDYGKLALDTAKQMRLVDPSIELCVSGSSHINMPDFAKWDYTVLDYTYDFVDYISIHQYYSNSSAIEDYLARGLDFDNYIKSVIAICDAVKAKKRSSKTINIAFDEWNVWTDGVLSDIPKFETAPHIGEMAYSLKDALVSATMLMTLQNNCDRVKIACLAQLVNAIAPIMTEKGGKAWVQANYYPFMYASKYGNGTVLQQVISCDTFSSSKHEKVPYIASSVIYNEEEKEIYVFAVNRSLTDEIELNMNFENFGNCNLAEHIELYCDDIEAVNTKDNEAVTPQKVISDKAVLKKHSWNLLKYKY
ncbi:MAG: alpha-N-arabinofuranosidase [Clostridia bacterium]|nr:alpha-N-arabinofuranosidase [Clostridia bacterium]